jgi:hypothetical protein
LTSPQSECLFSNLKMQTWHALCQTSKEWFHNNNEFFRFYRI